MKIAIVGTGIAGLTVAHHLHERHDLTVFEAAEWIGGHTHTVDIETPAGPLAIDTGFIVFNEHTYPGYCELLRELNVPWQASDMSFSVRCEATGLEYNGTDMNGLFAQRRNLVSPRFWGMIRDIMRFYKAAPAVMEPGARDMTLGEFLTEGRYGQLFIDKHLIPMGAAVWSATRETMWGFPMRFLVQFFHNHGFLRVDDRPQWLTVQGGSREYVRVLTQAFADRIHLRTPVVAVRRTPEGVKVTTKEGGDQFFDRVVLATHGDTSLALLKDARETETELLSAFRFQANEVTLHTDVRQMPQRKRAWASWNYHLADSELPTVTYWMNRLQDLKTEVPYMVSLNRNAEIASDTVLRQFVYHHPIFTPESVAAAARHSEIDGRDGVHFCGAYWRYGFHEDGVQSGLDVVRHLDPAALARKAVLRG
jgi:uncharacterized protein